jgi:signal recognition particle subunit SRP54
MGSLKSLLGLIPGLGSQLKKIEIDDKQLVYIETIISSMTPEERKKPELLDKSPSRRERISKGSGRSYQEVNALVKRFDEMKRSMQAMAGMDEKQMERQMRTGQGMPQAKPKKGKGKGRGNFRI